MSGGKKPRVLNAKDVAATLRRSWCAYVSSTVLSPCGHCMPCYAAALLDQIPDEETTEAESIRAAEHSRLQT